MCETFQTLIDPHTLYANLHHEDWVIVDCRFDVKDPPYGPSVYRQSHIPGAQYAHLDDDLSGKTTGTNGRHPLPEVDQIASKLSIWGIDSTTQVVVYDDQGGGFAARLWWLLRYLGHMNVAVLDGGFPAWQEAGYPEVDEVPKNHRRTFQPVVQTDLLIQIDDLEKGLASDEWIVVDSRAPERFSGEEETIDPVGGHIPGAVNHYWGTNLTDRDNFKDPDSLNEVFMGILGNRDASKSIFYCGSGVTGCHNILAMEVAGLVGAKLYAGSWSEWSADPSRPIISEYEA